MSLYKRFKTDPDKEKEGMPVRFDDTTVITVARAGGGNKKYVKAMERVQRKLNVRQPDNSESMEILREVYADTVILSWEGVVDEDGIPMLCDKPNKIKLLHDLPELFTELRRVAESMETFKAAEIEESAGN